MMDNVNHTLMCIRFILMLYTCVFGNSDLSDHCDLYILQDGN